MGPVYVFTLNDCRSKSVNVKVGQSRNYGYEHGVENVWVPNVFG